ncbi:response regulator [Paenibacillus oryzisoli]|uniref:response regulator transcription factor n=1 Tax=Paenibacillus oryzisoli TaxID=1850517 RepID=UPI003D2BAC48
MRIMLVEDEPLFRKGLAKMIAGSGTRWTVCGEAENGQVAELMIQELRPDLVMTDIRMPAMDGLQLLKQTKAHFPSTEFIVVTGYQDFHYAQTALRSGALDLLVKPCSMQDIFDVLHKVEVLLAEREAVARQAASDKQLLLENTLRAVMLRFPYALGMLEELKGMPDSYRLLMIQIMDFFPVHRAYRKQDVSLLQFSALNIIGEMMDIYGVTGTLLGIESGRFALLFDAAAKEEPFVEASCRTVQQLLGLPMGAACSGLVGEWTQLPDVYESLLEKLKASIPVDKANGQEAAMAINRARQQLISAQLAAFFSSGQIDAMKSYLEQHALEISGINEEAWRIEALSFSFALQDTMRKQFGQESDSLSLTDRISKLHDCHGKDEAGAWMKEELERFWTAFQAWQNRHSAGAISRAVRYMQERYTESLSLQQVAAQVHLNATYFSHVFKKETGFSFVQYLLEMRMEKAKQLLANTDMNITEISGAIGYDLPNYFAKLFRQCTGLSPKEFRKQNQI